MSENKKFIVFFSWVSSLFFILTYIFSTVRFSWRYLSNEFLVVVFGGLFASFGVMLLSEVKKYYINKRSTEDHLYFTLLNLYSEFVMEEKNTDVYLKNDETMVPFNLFSDRAQIINSYVYSLRVTDYSPFKENQISKQWKDFKQKEFLALDNHVIACNTYLSIAINQEKIKSLNYNIMQYNPVGKDRDVNITLRKMKADAIEREHAIDILQTIFSSVYGNRYQWKAYKENLKAMSIGLPTENPKLKSFFEE